MPKITVLWEIFTREIFQMFIFVTLNLSVVAVVLIVVNKGWQYFHRLDEVTYISS